MKKMVMKMLSALMLIGSTILMAGGNVSPVADVKVIYPEVKTSYYMGVHGTGSQLFLNGNRDWFSTEFFNDISYGAGVQAGVNVITIGNFTTALEGRYTWSVADDKGFDTATGSIFLKPGYDFGSVKLYALLGYSDVTLDSIQNIAVSAYDKKFTTDGFAGGIGIETTLYDTLTMFIDYTANPSFDLGASYEDVENEVITVGLNYNF